MLKSLLTTFWLTIAALTSIHAQTLKVSAVDGSDNKIYKEVAKKYLGKEMILTIYDNSITMVLAGKAPVNLKKISGNDYSILESDNEYESCTFYLTIIRTVGVITSASLKYEIKEKGGSYRTASFSLIAKRF
jgi:hypothetical protein